MNALSKLGLVLALALTAGCVDETSDRWLLEELRVLGVKAEPAEAAPGASVDLAALVVDPIGGADRATQIAWGVCTPDPTLGQASCTQPGRTVPLGFGSAANLTVASDALDGLTPEQALLGIDLFVVVAASAPAVDGVDGEDAETAFKRVRVSTDPSPNTNPRLSWFNPATAPEDGEQTLLQAAVTEESVETYEGPFGPEPETIRFSWYTTAGALDRGVTLAEPYAGELGWEAKTPATLYVVTRDGRGGIDWAIRQVP